MLDYRAESKEETVYCWQKRSAFGQAVASHGEANRKCLQTQRRVRREQDASARSLISTAGNGSFLDLSCASCLFSSLVLPGRSSELDSPSLFLDLLGAFSKCPSAGRKQLSPGQGCPCNSSGSRAAGAASWASTVPLTVWLWWDQRSEWARWKGCLSFLSLPGQELLIWGIWRAQGACGRPAVMHKMPRCTSFCSDKIKCPGFTPSEYFIIVPSLSRSCALEQNTAAVISSHFHCYQSLGNAAFRVNRMWWLTRLKTSCEVPRINSIWLYSTGTF